MSHYRRCRHCGAWSVPHDAPSLVCGSCAVLVREAGCDDEPRESEQERRERFHADRVAHVKQEWERGRRQLLARALDREHGEWAVPSR